MIALYELSIASTARARKSEEDWRGRERDHLAEPSQNVAVTRCQGDSDGGITSQNYARSLPPDLTWRAERKQSDRSKLN